MKIYTRIKLDMDTGETLEEDSFEYDGPLSLVVEGVSGADGGADGDVMTAGDRDSPKRDGSCHLVDSPNTPGPGGADGDVMTAGDGGVSNPPETQDQSNRGISDPSDETQPDGEKGKKMIKKK